MNKIICSLVLLLVFSSDSLDVKGQNTDGREWKLVFSDEFNQKNGSQPDLKKWVCCIRYNAGWNRWISNSKEVVYIKNGQLVCRAIPNTIEPSDTAKMLTGAIETRGKFTFQYGKIEVRMKTNMKRGNFPAAWMVPDYETDKRYGEIDIVETFGNDSRAAHNIHTHRSHRLKKEGIQREFKEKLDITKWHVYGVIWDKERIVWTVDGKKVGEYKKINTTQMVEEGQWTFDRLFYIRLNQSVGDGSHPLLIPNTNQIYETQFDWIRVYQRK